MLRVNKKIEYGIIALLYLAAKEDKTASVREMSATAKVPETLLSKIMQSLKNVGMVSAVYGNHGGYKLTKELAHISLLDLTTTLAGPIEVAECIKPGSDDCPVRVNCSIVAPMNVLNSKIIQLFENTSVEALRERKAL